MVIPNLPHVELPVTLTPKTPKGSDPITERFSTDFKDNLYTSFLQQLGGALVYMYRNAKSHAAIDQAMREMTILCGFLVDNGHAERIKSLNDLDTELLNDYLSHLKKMYPPHTKDGKSRFPWYAKYKALQSRLSPFLSDKTFPYVQEPKTTPTEGHTPLAFDMILKASRSEIQRIRGKIGKWEAAINNPLAREVDLKWFEKVTFGRPTTQLSKEQLEKIETLIFDQPNTITPREEAKTLRLDWDYYRQVRYRWGKKGRENGRPNAPGPYMTVEILDQMEEMIFEKAPLSLSKEAALLGLNYNYYRQLKNLWKKKGREEGRPLPKFTTDDIDITIYDICKTIHHYLPDWPIFGAPIAGKTFRVYQYERGPLVGTFDTKKDADDKAREINGVVRKKRRTLNSTQGLNPAELLFYYRGQTEGILASKLSELLPNGFSEDIIEKYFATTYDWTVILIHWLCLTGWNLEAVRSVPLTQLIRMFKKNGPEDLLSKDHTIFSAQIKLDKEEQKFEKTLAAISGIKNRSQPEGRPKLYTHISDRDEEYGLVRVLADYYKLIKPLHKYLMGNKCNCILVGVSDKKNRDSTSLTFFGPGFNNTSYELHMRSFFEKNAIYEEEGGCRKVKSTSARKLRTSFFTKLQHMGVPITTQMFLGRWSSVDTLMLSYAGDESSLSLVRQRARKTLNELQGMFFKGTLPEYTQSKTGTGGAQVIQIIDWLGMDVTACKDPWNPTWEGNEKWLERDNKGKLVKGCGFADMCLFCKQCEIRPESLKFLIQWDKDIRDYARKVTTMMFPEYLDRRQQAIREIFEQCEEDSGWKERLEEAEEEAMEPDFTAPPVWSQLRR